MSSVDKKRANMLAKLEARHKIDSVDSVPVEDIRGEDFESKFSRQKLVISQMLDRSSDVAQDSLKNYFDEIAQKLSALQKSLAESQVSLSAYEIRKAQSSVHTLQQRFQQRQDQLVQKKSFAFRARRKDAEKTVEDAPDSGARKNLVNLATADFDLSGLKNEKRSIEHCEAKDVALSGLDNCHVIIKDCANTIHMSKLNGCTIVALPIWTSVFVEECTDCHIVVACQQLRIHSTNRCSFYLHVTSNAIIEDCSQISFAPYTLKLDADSLASYFEKARLDKNRNNWDKVEDFNWLSVDKPSPNWNVIEENNRKMFFIE